MKKIILLILLVLALTSITGFGATFSDISGTPYEEAVSFLHAFEIVDGFPDGSFRPDETVTRAQVAKMTTIMMGYKDFVANMESTYTDMTNHWASRYVDVANAFDIVHGYLDGTFGPDDNITYSEAVTMVVRTLGYTDASLPGNWPFDYYVKAGDLGIVKDIPITAGAATRGDVALMIYRGLFQEYGTVNNGQIWQSSNKTMLSKLGSEKTVAITPQLVTQYQDQMDLSPYLYYSGVLYFNKESRPIYFKNINSQTYEGVVKAITGQTIIVEDPNGNRKPFGVNGTPITFNQAKGTISSLQNAHVKVVYETQNNQEVVNGVIATKVTDIALVTEPYQGGNRFNGWALPMNGNQVNGDKIQVSGAAEELSEIRANDVVYVYETEEPSNQKSHLSIHVVRNRVEGTLTETGNNTVNGYSIIAGRRYNHSEIYTPVNPFAPGYYVEAYLDALGNVVQYRVIRDMQQPNQYGLILSLAQHTDPQLFQISLLDNAGQARQYTISRETAIQQNLASGQVIQYSLRNTTITNVARRTLEAYDGSYNATTGYLVNADAIINTNTILFHKSNGSWTKMSQNQLGEFVKGRIIRNTGGNYVEFMLLDEGIRVTYPNTLYGVIRDNAMVLDANGDRVHKWTAYVDGNTDTLYSSSGKTESLESWNQSKGQLVKITMAQDRVTGFSVLKPEIDFAPIERVYDSNLLRVQGTFYEYSQQAVIYEGVKTDTGYTVVGTLTKDDIATGDWVRLYDLYGNYDGIMDILIVIKP